MTRIWIFSAVCTVAIAACGENVTGPEPRPIGTTIRVRVDWPLAQAPWLVGAWWRLEGPDHSPPPPASTSFDSPRWSSGSVQKTLAAGSFYANGWIERAFSAKCIPGDPLIGYSIEVWGEKQSTPSGGRCTPPKMHMNCTNARQEFTISDMSGDPRCTVDAWVERDIDLSLDWSLAREPGFEAATWTLFERRAHPDLPRSTWVPVEEGSFAADGTAGVRFHTMCEPGEEHFLNHRIEVSGRFGALVQSFDDPECRLLHENIRCTGEHQTVTTFRPPSPYTGTPQQCAVP